MEGTFLSKPNSSAGQMEHFIFQFIDQSCAPRLTHTRVRRAYNDAEAYHTSFTFECSTCHPRIARIYDTYFSLNSKSCRTLQPHTTCVCNKIKRKTYSHSRPHCMSASSLMTARIRPPFYFRTPYLFLCLCLPHNCYGRNIIQRKGATTRRDHRLLIGASQQARIGTLHSGLRLYRIYKTILRTSFKRSRIERISKCIRHDMNHIIFDSYDTCQYATVLSVINH